MMRTFRMVAEPGCAIYGAPNVAAPVTVDVVLRGGREDVDAVTPIIKAFLGMGGNLIGSWVDERTERESVTFSDAS